MKLKLPAIQRHVELERHGDTVHVLIEVARVSIDADGSDLVMEFGGRSSAVDALIDEARSMLGVKERQARAKRKAALKVIRSE